MTTTRRLWLAALCAASLQACQAGDQQVGSECAEEGCPEAAAIQRGLTCQVSGIVATIGVTAGVPEAGLCLPRPIPVDALGLVACRLRWDPSVPPADDAEPASCDPPFLEPADEAPGRCVVRQLTPAERMAGTERGWFYSLTDDCPRVELSAGATAPDGSLHLECATALASDQEGVLTEVDPNLCARPAASDGSEVGLACLPQLIPPGGFDSREASVEAPSGSCSTGVCLVYALEGDPSSGCAPPSTCPTAEELAHSVYCSCRCDADGGPGPECACPDGFSCREVLSSGPETVRGGYCVRND